MKDDAVPVQHQYGTLRELDKRRVPHPVLSEVLEYYDSIIKDAPYDDVEWDFVMTAAEYRLLRVAAMIGAEHPPAADSAQGMVSVPIDDLQQAAMKLEIIGRIYDGDKQSRRLAAAFSALLAAARPK